MKKVYKYLACAVALSSALSCTNLNETPVFADSDSFVAFDKTAISVDETAGTVTIPVTIAAPTTKKVSVAYAVEDGTAKQGTNYSLVDDAAVLVFDGESYSQTITLNIVNYNTTEERSGYTGDLSFTVSLVSAGDLDLGFAKTCTIKIVDLDHPLADILGTYACSGEEYWDGPVTWTANFLKDDADETVVWIDALLPMFEGSYPSADFRVYGNVSDDHKTITIPAGQIAASKNGSYDVQFNMFDGSSIYDEGNIVLTMDESGAFVSDAGFTASALLGGEYQGNFSIMVGGTFAKK